MAVHSRYIYERSKVGVAILKGGNPIASVSTIVGEVKEDITLEELEQFFSLTFEGRFSNFLTTMNLLFQMRRMTWERWMLWPHLKIGRHVLVCVIV